MGKSSLNRLARAILPGPVYDALSVVKRHRQSLMLDARFQSNLDRYTLDPVLSRNLEVVPDRAELLRRLPQGGVMAEVGVARGRFTRQILDICRPDKLYLIDLWSAESARYGHLLEEIERAVQSEMAEGRVEICRGYSWEMIAALPDASLDLIYIDAAHDYDSVGKDLAASLRKMSRAGIIAGHDYTRWSSKGLHRWGVVEAVNEFANRNRWEMRFLSNEPGRHLSYALQRLPDP